MLRIISKIGQITNHVNCRTFLSPAYYCNEVWEQRLKDQYISKVKLDELYNELDQRYQKTGKLSVVDVDIFCNAVKDDMYTDELLDVIHKSRLGEDACNVLNSTSHAVVRNLLNTNKYEALLAALDDRLNYGIFLDYYTANLLLDTFWKNKDYVSGARVSSQMMLQEEFEHPLTLNLSLLHCYKFLQSPVDWPKPEKAPEPEEEVKIRVKYLRNPYFDDHFDLRDPLQIVGKTIFMISKPLKDSVDKSFALMGLILHGKKEKADNLIKSFKSNKSVIYKEVIDLIPNKNDFKEMYDIQIESIDLENLLKERVEKAGKLISEQDIFKQCELYSQWTEDRNVAMNKQLTLYGKVKKMQDIQLKQQQLQEKEKLLWFFENEEKIELLLEATNEEALTQQTSKKKTEEDDENYIPPEVGYKPDK